MKHPKPVVLSLWGRETMNKNQFLIQNPAELIIFNCTRLSSP
jgi:hypothetical protein